LPKDKKVLICGINITPLVLLIALGFHSVFEGIALGLIKDLQVFINLMIGITIHHIVACISYGVSLGKSKNKNTTAMILSIVGLSCFESGGLAIGLGLSDAPDFVSSIILSFAGGTFVYIACSEILVHEFSEKKHRYWKFLMFILGAAIITCLWFLHAEE
jgi:zinc transporter ZupT